MVRLVCAVFIFAAVIQTATCALSEAERRSLNILVNISRIELGKSGVPEGDYYAFLDANRLSEGCNETAVWEEEGAVIAYPGEDECEGALASRVGLAAQSPDDAQHVSCDAMFCPNYNGSFVVCAFKVPEYDYEQY